MRRIMLLAALLAALSIGAGSPGTCVVTPDPVDLTTMAPTNERYNVTADGATPGIYYEIGLFQKGGVGLRDERRIWLGLPDENGVISADLPVYDGVEGVPYSLWSGTVKVEIKTYRTGGGPGGVNERLATCYFDVIRS